MASILVNAIIFLSVLVSGSKVVEQKDRTITQVVKLLQTMLEKSKKEGDEERVIYAKFKCYCDQSEAEKKASIKTLTEQIALLESNIEETQGSTGGLSSECADLKVKMAENEDARDTATNIRNKEHKAFIEEEADLEQAISQMVDAIEVLSKVGADQTKSTGADNAQFMAGHKKASLVSLQSQVQDALKAATALMSPTQANTAAAFLQAPFTGTYTSQSAQVMGIIKNMRDTFKANLADAREKEKSAEDSYEKLMKVLKKAHKEMSQSYADKQKSLGGNDGSLADDKKTLADSIKKKDSDQEFLDSLLPMCEKKAEAYANRKLLRANEEAAIAEAISILNSDDAFATFQTVDATTGGYTGAAASFVQIRSVQRHLEADTRQQAQTMLKKAAVQASSARLSKVATLLGADNPFDTVLKEIDTMLEVIAEEGKSDQENLDWCNDERDSNEDEKAEKEKEMLALEKEINKLKKTINDPKDGLKAIISQTEESLLQNKDAQTKQTTQRLNENMAYQKDVKNLVSAESILKRAIKVLKTYYDGLQEKLEAGEAALLQEDPAPPESFSNKGYAGQSGDGKDQGGGVIKQLEFILEETQNEHDDAHKEEQDSQMDYEKSMTELKKDQADDEKLLAKTQDSLAEAEKDLLNAEEDLKATTNDRDAVVAYLEKIKPGCDFITKNFDLREKNRATESAALKKAIRLIEGTPAYKTFESETTVESFKESCLDVCTKPDPDHEGERLPAAGKAGHVKCLACEAGVEIPAYCAGHKDTPGC